MFFDNPIQGPGSSWPVNEKPSFETERELGSAEENRIEMTPAPVAHKEEYYRDQCMRLAAELDNLRKRQRREIERAAQQERRAILGDLLEVLDSFDRALSMQGAEGNQWLEGFDSTREQLLETLKRYGAEPFQAHGKVFDPSRHEAIATAHIDDFHEGTVVEVIQTGYQMNDGTLLRPAKVVVVKHG